MRRVAVIAAAVVALMVPSSALAHNQVPTIHQAHAILHADFGQKGVVVTNCRLHRQFTSCTMTETWHATMGTPEGPITTVATAAYPMRLAWRGCHIIVWEFTG